MRYLKQLADAVEMHRIEQTRESDIRLDDMIKQARGFLERVKSFEYQGEITIKFNGDINMSGIKADLDDLLLALSDKKANESFTGEVYAIINRDPVAESVAIPAVQLPEPTPTTPQATSATEITGPVVSQVALG